jgi:UDP-N-acetylmuramoylalanine--D-glutamate ligase
LKDKLKQILVNKRILILGFGKEGQSSYKLISQFIPESMITIADRNKEVFSSDKFQDILDCDLISGEGYLDGLNKYDLIIKSPGIPGHKISKDIPSGKITSQTELFLKLFSAQTIGITGTKGKSTTSSLIFHILSTYFDDVVLVGNIGVPPFDLFDEINEKTKIVFEMSGHQLVDVSVSPHYAVLLNIFQEHLDHFGSYDAYQNAKFNISRFQNAIDYLIYNVDSPLISNQVEKGVPATNLLSFSMVRNTENGIIGNEKDEISLNQSKVLNFHDRRQLPGKHNLMNIMAAVLVCEKMGVPIDTIQEAVMGFKGLPHRLEYIGEHKGIRFYNDSIATIPEAVVEAVKTLKDVDTLILGGKDRGINYSGLVNFLLRGSVQNVIFIGEAGQRILKEIYLKDANPVMNCFPVQEFQEMEIIIGENTHPGKICLLSPAASSYDMFSSFEERGEAFKKIAENL